MNNLTKNAYLTHLCQNVLQDLKGVLWDLPMHTNGISLDMMKEDVLKDIIPKKTTRVEDVSQTVKNVRTDTL